MMLSAPDDYGLTPEETLESIVDEPPTAEFEPFWAAIRDAVVELPRQPRGTVDGEINPLVIESTRSVRVAARLAMPDCTPRGVVVTTHGYAGVEDGFPSLPEAWTEAGMATLRLRVRGYPPSSSETGDLRDRWITRGLEDTTAWIVPGAVADVMRGYLAARAIFGPSMPIGLHGESLGGGLAVIAAAQLERLGDPPHRVALGLPSLGAWTWRRGRYCNGSGGEVEVILDALRADGDSVLETLRLADAAVHARDVRAPALVKLALRDDVVPAPSAAAVYNALNGERMRFVTPFGHFDGGLANARRHLIFERLHTRFLDPDVDLATIEVDQAMPNS